MRQKTPKRIKHLRTYRATGERQPLTHAPTPVVTLSDQPMWRGLALFIGTALLALIVMLPFFLWSYPFGVSLECAIKDSIKIASGVSVLYYLFPLIAVMAYALFHQQRLPRQQWQRYSLAQKGISMALVATGGFYLFNHLFVTARWAWHHHDWPAHAWHSHGYVTNRWHEGIILLDTTGLLMTLAPYGFTKKRSASAIATPRFARRRQRQLVDVPPPITFYLGQSTGTLAKRWHPTGLAANLSIVLSEADATQNLLVLGGSGSGKTTRIMQPLLAQLLDQACGALLFDVKGDVMAAASQLSKASDRSLTLIGPSHHPINLLAGLSPEMAASFLKSALLLSNPNPQESFWIETATELCRNTLGCLTFLPHRYTLYDLYHYLFDQAVKETIQAELTTLQETLEPPQQRLLNSYLRYETTIFSTFEEKVKSNVHATIAQVLAPFCHPELIDAFCHPTDLSLQALLDGAVYLVSLPLSRWGLGAKVAYTFIKLRFFNLMQSRHQQPDWNQTRPVVLMCDEYQTIISANKDGLSDLNFWDKSRASKTIGMISGQSVNSFYAAIGNREITDAILQNFRQKICFKTEDTATIQLLQSILGPVKVKRKTVGQSSGRSSRGWFSPNTHHESHNESMTDVYEPVIDASLIRQLTPNHAIAILSLRGHSMDDVLALEPLYV